MVTEMYRHREKERDRQRVEIYRQIEVEIERRRLDANCRHASDGWLETGCDSNAFY